MLITNLLFCFSKKVYTFALVIKPHKYTTAFIEKQIIYGDFTIL